MGGGDPTSLTLKVLKALLQEDWPGYAFYVILGPGYPDPHEIETLIGGSKKQYNVVINPANLIPLLQRCDFAICAGGRTMYELLYLKKDFFPIASVEHEAEAILEFNRRGIIKVGLTSWDPNAFISNIKDLLLDCSDFQK